LLTPLVSTLFGITYYYESESFIKFLIVNPIPRRAVIFGHLSGLIFSLVLAIFLGLGLPLIFYGVVSPGNFTPFLMLILVAMFLTIIFTGFAYYIGVKVDNRIKGFGYAILLWLFLAVIYDGIFLLLLFLLQDYPLEKFALTLTFLNPIDLSRLLIILRLDFAALLGYTGAVFRKFFGTSLGMFLSLFSLIIWSLLPVFLIKLKVRKKDF